MYGGFRVDTVFQFLLFVLFSLLRDDRGISAVSHLTSPKNISHLQSAIEIAANGNIVFAVGQGNQVRWMLARVRINR